MVHLLFYDLILISTFSFHSFSTSILGALVMSPGLPIFPTNTCVLAPRNFFFILEKSVLLVIVHLFC
jgi:hypothetical protein